MEGFLQAVCPTAKNDMSSKSSFQQSSLDDVIEPPSVRRRVDRTVTATPHSQSAAIESDIPREAEAESLSNPHVLTEDEGQDSDDSAVYFLPNSEFTVFKAKSSCALVSIIGMPDSLSPDERIAYLSHIFGDDLSFVRVVGALLSFVVQNGMLNTIGANDDTIHISTISHRNYCDAMHISPTTMRALHVFHDEAHPIGRGSMRGKESRSLYGLLKSHVKTQSAQALLRSWIMHPTTDLKVIEERQFLVSCFLDRSNRSLTVALRDALKGVKNVPSILMRFHRVAAGLSEWKGLYGSAKAFISLLDALKSAIQQCEKLKDSPLIDKALGVRKADLQEVVSWIFSVVDFEESNATGRLIVSEGFSDEIDELKRSFCAMDDFLSSVGAQEYNRLTTHESCPSVSWLRVVYKLQIGFLIVLPEDDVDAAGLSVWGDFGFTFVFHSKESGYHFRNDRCQQLDDEIGDIHATILELEGKAFRYLEKNVLVYAESLYIMADIVRELDCLQGLAACTREHSWVIPTLHNDGNGFEIENGGHALLSCNTTSFVTNSTQMKIGDVHVVTGYVLHHIMP